MAQGKIVVETSRLDSTAAQVEDVYKRQNMERVKRYCGDSFLMGNETTIPISQSRRKIVRQQFLDYMGNAVSPNK